MVNILIIDDDPDIQELLKKYLDQSGHGVVLAGTLADGFDKLLSEEFDLVFLDVNLPDGNGLDALSAIKGVPSEPEIIIITGEGDAQGAKMAIDSGVWDYVLKPLSHHNIILNLKRSLEFRASRKALKSSSNNMLERSQIIGSSPKITAKLNMAAQCAKSDATVLITGQTGTGKELFASVIHKNSRQKSNRFIVVDCASLPEQLVESVLFGHVKGAYTGAESSQDGLVKKADGGTLFLDEIGELPLSIQAKFLRMLQERKFKPVGGTKEIESKFRLISATNRDLDRLADQKLFRKDLLFRINTIHIDLPPLRECKGDIKDLTLHYIYFLCKHHGIENKGFVPDFLSVLESYDWPGNTRELISSLESAILADPESPMLYPNYLPNHVRLNYVMSSIDQQSQGDDGFKSDADTLVPISDHLHKPIKPLKQIKDLAIAKIERQYLERLMKATKGDMDTASSMSCMSKSRIYQLLKKYNIPLST